LECIMISKKISKTSDTAICCHDVCTSFGALFFVVMNRVK
jgi:hypothetical protein